jgi:hypothetical protein
MGQWFAAAVKVAMASTAKAATVGAGNSGCNEGSARADNNQPKSGSKDVQKSTLNVIF